MTVPTRLEPMPDLPQAILQQMPEAVVVADRDDTIRVWYRGAGVLLGFTPEEAFGRGLELSVPERFRRPHDDSYRRAITTG